MDNRILFDWFSCTFDVRNPYFVTELLGMETVVWQEIQGMYGYKKRLYYDGISIHFDGSLDQGVWLEMSGRGCRVFEDFSCWEWLSFIAEIVENTPVKNITRVDIAFDSFDDSLDLNVLFQDTYALNFVSKFHDYEINLGNKGITIYHGSPKSMVRFRIYDKAAESCTEYSWVRVEVQLRSERAFEFINEYLSCQNLSELYLGLVLNYLRYVEPNGDSNKRRWPLTAYWSNFCGSVSAVNIVSQIGSEYSYENLQRFVVNQAGGAIKTMIKLLGVDEFMDLIVNSHSQLNPKYQSLIDQQKITQA